MADGLPVDSQSVFVFLGIQKCRRRISTPSGAVRRDQAALRDTVGTFAG